MFLFKIEFVRKIKRIADFDNVFLNGFAYGNAFFFSLEPYEVFFFAGGVNALVPRSFL